MTSKNITIAQAIATVLTAIDNEYADFPEAVRDFRKRAFLGDNAYSTANSIKWHSLKQRDIQGEIREMMERGGTWNSAQNDALERKTEFYTALEQREELFARDHAQYTQAYKEFTGDAWLPRAGSRDVDAKSRQTAARAAAAALLDKVAATDQAA